MGARVSVLGTCSSLTGRRYSDAPLEDRCTCHTDAASQIPLLLHSPGLYHHSRVTRKIIHLENARKNSRLQTQRGHHRAPGNCWEAPLTGQRPGCFKRINEEDQSVTTIETSRVDTRTLRQCQRGSDRFWSLHPRIPEIYSFVQLDWHFSSPIDSIPSHRSSSLHRLDLHHPWHSKNDRTGFVSLHVVEYLVRDAMVLHRGRIS